MIQTCEEMNMAPMEIDPAAMAWLVRQPWPGNVRELLNMIRRLVVFSNGGPINTALIRLVDPPGRGVDESCASDNQSRIKPLKTRPGYFFPHLSDPPV